MSRCAFFLWVGGPIPDIARISVLSAAEAGFDTVLFTDRHQNLKHSALRLADWREIGLPWNPIDVRLEGRDKPYFAGFANLFRYRLLSVHAGWWFDCDTIILKHASEFEKLICEQDIVVGLEDDATVNNAVIGADNPDAMKRLYEAALPHYPFFKTWGITGPKLMTETISAGNLKACIQPKCAFYPIHHNEIADVFLPSMSEELREQESDWFCLSLWSEVLSRSGLAYLSPDPESYLGELLARRPELGEVAGDPANMAAFLAENARRLDDMDSGRLALKTLVRKLSARLSLRGTRIG